MKLGAWSARLILPVASILVLLSPLALAGCNKTYPYQGSLTGNWTGQLTILGRAIPIGGTLSMDVDGKGVVSGKLNSTSGGANPATMSGQVDSAGNLTGTVSLTIGVTTSVSNWQGKMNGSGKSLGIQGTWTSQHGSGTFSATSK
jgi:hypothetical protein